MTEEELKLRLVAAWGGFWRGLLFCFVIWSTGILFRWW